MANPPPSKEKDDSDFERFIYRLESRHFNKNECFLCATSLDNISATEEHVIPKWAQKRFNLWNQQLVLLNRTSIPYRKLTVPCCENCNTYRLQPIERSIANAAANGCESVRNLGLKALFLWLGKVFYGIMYRELFLLLNKNSDDLITIATPEMIREYESHLFFLQAARDKIDFVDFYPGSIFVFKTQQPDKVELQWDFCDNVMTMFLAIRMGSVGIISVLGDGGAQQLFESRYKELMDFPLHPLQFRELCALIMYRSTLSTRTPKYFTISDSNDSQPYKSYQLPLGGLSRKPLFENWDASEYAKYISYNTSIPLHYLFKPPDLVKSWISDESGKLIFMDIKKYPYPFSQD